MRSILDSLGQGAKASIRYMQNLLGRRVSLLRVLMIGLLAVIVIVILADLNAFLRLPFYPFATKGAIYVDSPEVYTRERLVNDRYDQDHWLRRQLERLDAAGNLLTGRVTTRRASGMGIGDAGARSDGDPTTDAPLGDELELPFDQEFRIRAATRDMIRQMILENMLDDRHDLTGNTVYGLKFDTTVIPGTNTHQRAFVRLTLDVEPLFVGRGGSIEGLPTHVRQFFDIGFGRIVDRNDNPLFTPYDLYSRWLENIEVRLNDYLSVFSYSNSLDFQKACRLGLTDQELEARRDVHRVVLDDTTDTTTWRALEVVLGIDRRPAFDPYAHADTTAIALPQPWRDFLVLHRYGYLCAKDLHFVVEPLFEAIYVFPTEGNPVEVGYFPISGTPSGEQVAVHNPYGRPPDTQEEFEAIKPNYDITGSLIAYARGKGQLFPFCAKQSAKDPCEAPVEMVTVPSGFFNFMERIVRKDAYSYAIFPKNDLIGLIADTSRSTSLQERLGGDAGLGAWLELVQAMREASTRSVVVGFGEQSPARDRVEFGWVLSTGGDMQPIQTAQLALVSLPAWSSELRVRVTTGWLDRNSAEHAVQTVEMLVPLPPEYEAFDLFVGESAGLQPRILNDSVADQVVIACRRAEILIRGSRLWKSTSVTLGAQQATRIRVLPNMQGIIAEFDPVELPNAEITPGGAKVPLRVWTSEGMDAANDPVVIKLPDDAVAGRCPEKADAG